MAAWAPSTARAMTDLRLQEGHGTPHQQLRAGPARPLPHQCLDLPGHEQLRSGRRDEIQLHPTVKPVAMIADAIKDVSQRGGIVLDLFGGSGSTLIAAHKTGRRGYLCELDPVYCDRIIRRWQVYAKDDAVLEATGRASKKSGSRFSPAGQPESMEQHDRQRAATDRGTALPDLCGRTPSMTISSAGCRPSTRYLQGRSRPPVFLPPGSGVMAHGQISPGR